MISTKCKVSYRNHYAFLMDDKAFSRILAKVGARGLTYAADPWYRSGEDH